MVLYCPRCGSILPENTLWSLAVREWCGDCRLAMADAPATLAESYRETAYELGDWPAADRAGLTGSLADEGIAYRWEDGHVLAVPEKAEDTVDALIEEVEAQAGPETLGDGQVPVPDDDVDLADGGEEAHAAMSDLFVAADRLQHDPYDAAVAGDLQHAAEVVSASAPPYGIEPRVWQRVRTLAAAAVTSFEQRAGDDAVTGDARTLRDFLREYV